MKDIKEPYLQRVIQHVQENHVVGDELKRSIRENILQLMEIKSYRGSRHEQALPLRQKTHNNGKTAKKLRHYIMYDTSK